MNLCQNICFRIEVLVQDRVDWATFVSIGKKKIEYILVYVGGAVRLQSWDNDNVFKIRFSYKASWDRALVATKGTETIPCIRASLSTTRIRRKTTMVFNGGVFCDIRLVRQAFCLKFLVRINTDFLLLTVFCFFVYLLSELRQDQIAQDFFCRGRLRATFRNLTRQSEHKQSWHKVESCSFSRL